MPESAQPRSATDSESRSDAFAREAARRRSGILTEVWGYLRQNRKWWLLPILIALFLVGVLMFVGSSVVAPLVYPVF